ncbi:MAG TPA: hypothetical protein PKO42_03220 [Tenuifilaceae bacterium]|jgi:hypothetical protein|nr:hypothetical protein [Bacteroidales bacterium]HNT40689.1 hypothetical protein [Tenuifilaceae bacterium]MBP8642476.1 hypothetical protein [Bacteroidales bacterium]NLI86670.1 hypothetical protein [Bacteroidales bacterium]HNY08878.1 hypothetical protein [Tenuifilaceae bacterium]
MASRKDLKKDVDSLVGEVVNDCFTYMTLHGDKNRDKAEGIISKIMESRNTAIKKINNPGKLTDKKATKAHFKALQQELLVSADECFTELSKLPKDLG